MCVALLLQCVRWLSNVKRGPPFIAWVWSLLMYFRKEPHATVSPSIECTTWARWGRAELGAVRPHHWCGHTLGQPNRHRLALVVCWLGLDSSHAGVLAQVWSLDGLYLLFCLTAPFRLRILVYFPVLSCKTCVYKNSWKIWVVSPNSCFWYWYLLYFVLNVGNKNMR
jgi:hypothetical protein